jgi:pseudolysin
MQKRYQVFAISVISLACLSTVFAAQPINLTHQPVSILNSFAAAESSLKQISSDVDFNQTQHVRLKQTYLGYPVWGGDIVAHVPNSSGTSLKKLLSGEKSTASLNGTLYRDLAKDLTVSVDWVSNPAQKKLALQHAVELYQKNAGIQQMPSETQNDLIVYIDQDNKAHWTYLISFLMQPAQAMPAKPTYLMDATTFDVYEQWNDIQTLDDTMGGGFGGNVKMGKLVYDGLQNDLPELSMQRDSNAKICNLANSEVTVLNASKANAVISFPCEKVDDQHNNEYWDADQDAVNGGYSPGNDALFAGKVIKEMYQNWYNVPVLVQNGKPMMLVMRVHEKMDNAYWDGKQMTFGDGVSLFYPLVSLGVGGHEISHGFTQQHSGLVYSGQSGGLNEAFSDMAAQAAEFYAYGKNSWQIGPEIFKAPNKALRYMDLPSKDCEGKPSSRCSIDNVSQYKEGLDVHYSSGVFNRVFYLLGTAKNWDTRKAFDVMVKANMHYWTPRSQFTESACGVVKATQDYKYDMDAVKTAMNTVGIDISKC